MSERIIEVINPLHISRSRYTLGIKINIILLFERVFVKVIHSSGGQTEPLIGQGWRMLASYWSKAHTLVVAEPEPTLIKFPSSLPLKQNKMKISIQY